eukprot:6414540-Heterocapsa_arctica.AAC.1
MVAAEVNADVQRGPEVAATSNDGFGTERRVPMADLPVSEVISWDSHGFDRAGTLPHLHRSRLSPLGGLPVAKEDVREIARKPCAREGVRTDFWLRGESHREAGKGPGSLLAAPWSCEHRT